VEITPAQTDTVIASSQLARSKVDIPERAPVVNRIRFHTGRLKILSPATECYVGPSTAQFSARMNGRL
jgi:hypothetical protein